MAYRSLTVTPAYGRDYKSKAKAIADWNSGLDFRVQDYKLSGYINNADAAVIDITEIHIRYDQNRRIAVVKITH